MDRREARRAAKELKPAKGIFAVRCAAGGKVWVGNSPNLGAARTGTWFMLNNGSHFNKGLQAAWKAQGEAAFQFEILEQLPEDTPPLLLKDALRERQRHWEKELGASPMV